MSRIALLALLVAVEGWSCTKSPANQESATGPADRPTKGGLSNTGGAPPLETKGGPTDSKFRLSADEGKLAIEPPSDAKAGAEATVKISVTPGSEYKVNTEFPTKLTLDTTSGVTLVKAEFKAGGHDKDKGDADMFDEHGLAFNVKLTAAASGSYTINGSFKFAVCDKAGHQCLAKKEPIAIQVAAK
jgi:hypothetical protein